MGLCVRTLVGDCPVLVATKGSQLFKTNSTKVSYEATPLSVEKDGTILILNQRITFELDLCS